MKKILLTAAIAFSSMATYADILTVDEKDAGKKIDLYIPYLDTQALDFGKKITAVGLGAPQYYSADVLKSENVLLVGVTDAENAESSNLIVETEDGLLYEFKLTMTINDMVRIKPLNELP